jgi:radical SAM protein with 4Fe4S-binding SPASM domain
MLSGLLESLRIDTQGWLIQAKMRHQLRRLLILLACFPIFGHRLMLWAMMRKYGSRVITPYKIRNFLQVHRDMHKRVRSTQSLPYHLVLDTINACNLSCPFCPTGTRQVDRKIGRLGLERAKQVIDAICLHTIRADLYSWGEPFMDPDIFAITRHAHDRGLYTNIHSVLSIDKPDLGRHIVESGLDCLGVTIDGLEQESLQGYRYGANFSLVKRNIIDVLSARQALNSATPRVEIIFNVFSHNEHELPHLKKFAEHIGVDAIYPRRAFIFDESFVPRNPDYLPRGPEFSDTCWFLYVTLTVEVDGETSPCDTNTSKKWKTGDIDALGDLSTLWNNETYQAMRAYHNGNIPRKVADCDDSKSVLCEHCNFVEGCGPSYSKNLSPLPPSFVADEILYSTPERNNDTNSRRIPIYEVG